MGLTNGQNKALKFRDALTASSSIVIKERVSKVSVSIPLLRS